jgi:DNA uptake protein ComE-like DNA-binding protein
MTHRLEIFERGSEGREGSVGRFMAWLGLGPEGGAGPPVNRGAARVSLDPETGDDIEARIRSAAAIAAEAAERRAVDEILALEHDLARAKDEATAKLAELKRRLAETQARASAAERDAKHARAEAAEARRRSEEVRYHSEPQGEPQPAAANAGVASLSSAGFDELRALGMTVTQAKRLLAYRERLDGFDSLEDLDRVPGFPNSFLAQIKDRLAP